MNYAALCIGVVIGLPWLGALLVWWAGDGRPRLQHTLAVLFSVAAGVAAVLLIPLGSHEAAVKISVGGAFGGLAAAESDRSQCRPGGGASAL